MTQIHPAVQGLAKTLAEKLLGSGKGRQQSVAPKHLCGALLQALWFCAWS